MTPLGEARSLAPAAKEAGSQKDWNGNWVSLEPWLPITSLATEGAEKLSPTL